MNVDGRLQINLLGKPEVWLDGVPISRFSTAKTAALLYYLAATGQRHSRDSLAGLLWSDMPEANARRNLTKSLTVLRRLLEPYLNITPQRVGFDPEAPFHLDIHAFNAAVSDGVPSPETISFYRGDFLEGFFVKDALEFETWQLTERERLRLMALGALESLVEQAAGAGDFSSGIEYGRRLLALDPWRESAHRQLMLLLARSGQRAAALTQFEQCRQVLSAELGVEPMPETAALARRIQESQRENPYPLPTASSPFIGREKERAHIRRLLADPGCRLLSLIGLGGLGKTRLALAAAQQANRQHAWQFLHGVLFLSLTTVATPDLLPGALADALDLALDGRQDPVDHLVHFIREKELLLVLDNYEHLLPETGIVSQLLLACPNLKILVTSREPLLLEAEHRFELDGLSFPEADSQLSIPNYQLSVSHYQTAESAKKTALADYPAVQLFLQAAHNVRPQFALTAENAPDVVRICQALSGIPLALKLAASWLRVLAPAEIATEIDRGLDLLATSMRDVPPRQRSMTAVFDHSWALLTGEEQKSLAALSVFQGGFTAQAAQEITGATLPTLAALVDRTLLHLLETEGGARYFLHELTRQYTAEKLARSPETAASLRDAHTRYYAHLLNDLTPALTGKTPQRAYAVIQREIGNARQAWQQAVDRLDLDSLHQLMEPFTDFLNRQGWFAEGQSRLAAAIEAMQAADLQNKTAVRLLSGLLARQGIVMERIGQFAGGEAALQQSIALARRVADPHLLIHALLELGALQRDQSRFAEAQTAFQESWEIATELDDPRLLAHATQKLAVITWDLGDHAGALARHREALAQFEALADSRRIATTLNSLGNVVMSQGYSRAAIAYFERALPLVRELEDWLLLDTVLINLGMANQQLGEIARSRQFYSESLEICRRIGDQIGVAYCLTGLGQAATEEGDLAEARDLLGQSLALNREMGRGRYVAINTNLLGDLAVLEEDWPTAVNLFQESLALSQRIDHPWGIASSRRRLGDAALAAADETAAVEHYLAALALGQEMAAPVFVQTALTNLARIMLNQGTAETAVAVLRLVQNEAALSDSLRQTVVELMGSESAFLTPEQEASVEKVLLESNGLKTAVALIQASGL